MMKQIIIAILLTEFLVLLVGFLMGYRVGYGNAFEDNIRIDCESEFGFTPYKEISGNCLKYFKSK